MVPVFGPELLGTKWKMLYSGLFVCSDTERLGVLLVTHYSLKGTQEVLMGCFLGPLSLSLPHSLPSLRGPHSVSAGNSHCS